MANYYVLLKNDRDEVLAERWAGNLKEAKGIADYLLTPEYERYVEATHADLGTDKVEVLTREGVCVFDKFYRPRGGGGEMTRAELTLALKLYDIWSDAHEAAEVVPEGSHARAYATELCRAAERAFMAFTGRSPLEPRGRGELAPRCPAEPWASLDISDRLADRTKPAKKPRKKLSEGS